MNKYCFGIVENRIKKKIKTTNIVVENIHGTVDS